MALGTAGRAVYKLHRLREFHDHLKNRDFTLGVVFDCYEDGDFEHRSLCWIHIRKPLVVNSVPMSYKELRSFVNRNYKGKVRLPGHKPAVPGHIEG